MPSPDDLTPEAGPPPTMSTAGDPRAAEVDLPEDVAAILASIDPDQYHGFMREQEQAHMEYGRVENDPSRTPRDRLRAHREAEQLIDRNHIWAWQQLGPDGGMREPSAAALEGLRAAVAGSRWLRGRPRAPVLRSAARRARWWTVSKSAERGRPSRRRRASRRTSRGACRR